MQGSSVSECKKSLMAELLQAKQLLIHLQNSSKNDQLCTSLAPKILSCIDKSISVAKSLDNGLTQQPSLPRCTSNSPRSEDSGEAFRDHGNKDTGKKRKTMPKWSSQVRVGVGAGTGEGLGDDGYSWRKYGQKDILGAKHPRGYYRCTHRNSQGCQATKQVQRSDADPQLFDITYHGAHTCLNRNQTGPTPSRRENQQKPNKDLLLSFEKGLQVKTEGLNFDTDYNDSIPFAFGSSLVGGVGGESGIFFSPTTSESTYFSNSYCGVSSIELEQKLQTGESDFADMISTPNSSCSSTVVDLDLMFDFDTDFQFDQFDVSDIFQEQV